LTPGHTQAFGLFDQVQHPSPRTLADAQLFHTARAQCLGDWIDAVDTHSSLALGAHPQHDSLDTN
jgi:hypothetical protein